MRAHLNFMSVKLFLFLDRCLCDVRGLLCAYRLQTSHHKTLYFTVIFAEVSRVHRLFNALNTDQLPKEASMASPKRPLWTDLQATYLNAGRTGVLGIVLHDTAGTGTHNDTLYLHNPQDGRKVSVDFTVERDGSIWKLNPEVHKYYCNHAGRATHWRSYRNAEVNRVTVGIEIVQDGKLLLKPTYPVAQVKSVSYLCAWLTSTFGLAASDITTHRQIITDGSRSDPRKFPFDDKNGFWHYYWEAYGKSDDFLASLVVSDEE